MARNLPIIIEIVNNVFSEWYLFTSFGINVIYKQVWSRIRMISVLSLSMYVLV